ncbi:hypothetical protein I4U23_004248 [Adineta vaga]|nr:hypothetical protein I4U23_004248 [Adineta vaga]
MVTFETLPNEILLECFDYLNAPDIFYSFGQLNYRFKQLLENISLHFDCRYISKSVFDQFCILILLNPAIKKQIYSLILSNNPTCHQIQTFLSFFSFNEFSSLRSLILVEIDKDDNDKLKFILPYLSNLRYIHLIKPNDKLKSELNDSVPLLFQITSLITHLTLSDSSCCDLSHLFEYAPMLKYVNCRNVSCFSRWSDRFSNFSNYCAVHLNKLILTAFFGPFEYIEMLMKQTPNLKTLMISSIVNNDIIDAFRWQNLITSVLPQLTVFKFSFEFIYYNNDKITIFDKYQAFQSDFWLKTHRWYTEYSYEEDKAKIYTIPFASFPFTLPTYITTVGCDNIPKNLNKFNDVKNLTIYYLDIQNEYKYYFRNITSLILNLSYTGQIQNIQSLETIVNLSNLVFLNAAQTPQVHISSLLLNILSKARKLSELCISSQHISFVFKNTKLCRYLTERIKNLCICSYPTCFINENVTIEFCKVFSNLKHLTISIKQTNYVLILLERLSKLLTIKVCFDIFDNPIDLSSLESELRKRNARFRTGHTTRDYENDGTTSHDTHICIWIDNKYPRITEKL